MPEARKHITEYVPPRELLKDGETYVTDFGHIIDTPSFRLAWLVVNKAACLGDLTMHEVSDMLYDFMLELETTNGDRFSMRELTEQMIEERGLRK